MAVLTRLASALLLLSLLGCGPTGSAASPSTPAEVRVAAAPPARQNERSTLVAYIVNQNSDDVVAVDLGARQVIGRGTTGRNPHEIVASPDGAWLFTSDQ